MQTRLHELRNKCLLTSRACPDAWLQKQGKIASWLLGDEEADCTLGRRRAFCYITLLATMCNVRVTEGAVAVASDIDTIHYAGRMDLVEDRQSLLHLRDTYKHLLTSIILALSVLLCYTVYHELEDFGMEQYSGLATIINSWRVWFFVEGQLFAALDGLWRLRSQQAKSLLWNWSTLDVIVMKRVLGSHMLKLIVYRKWAFTVIHWYWEMTCPPSVYRNEGEEWCHCHASPWYQILRRCDKFRSRNIGLVS